MIETEAVLNSRPLSYVAVDDLDPPLTPSHLLSGYQILSLPDPSLSDDLDYETSTSSLTRRMRHFMKTSRYFWKYWRQELFTWTEKVPSNLPGQQDQLSCQRRRLWSYMIRIPPEDFGDWARLRK